MASQPRQGPIPPGIKGKEKDASKQIFNIYIAPWRPKTQRCSDNRELNQARSKADTVNRPVRTARTIVRHDSTQYCSTETVLLIFPFLQTNITSPVSSSSRHMLASQLNSLHHYKASSISDYIIIVIDYKTWKAQFDWFNWFWLITIALELQEINCLTAQFHIRQNMQSWTAVDISLHLSAWCTS